MELGERSTSPGKSMGHKMESTTRDCEASLRWSSRADGTFCLERSDLVWTEPQQTR